MSRLHATLGASIDPAGSRILGIPGCWLHGTLLVGTVVAFAWILHRRLALLRAAAPDPRLDRPGARLVKLLVVGFLQSRQPRYRVAGILHILIFFGFLTLLLRSLTLLGRGFHVDFELPGLGGGLGRTYGSVKDWTALVVLVCCVVLAVRRAFFRPARYHDRTATRSHGGEAYVILGLIALLMISDAFYEGSEIALADQGTWALPLASLAASSIGGLAAGTLVSLGVMAFWIHDVALCFFGCYLPVSKHFHVITALPNVFCAKLPPQGRVKPPRHDVEDLDALERIGVARLEDLTWKHLLDVYSCTDCGRCSDACPAYATGTPLSPRRISIATRDEAYRTWPAPFGRRVPAEDRPALVGGIIPDDALWACTTCGACEETCPVTIEYIDKIVDMRRFLVDEGRVPKSMQKALAEIEKRGNPYGKPGPKRGDWIEDGNGGCGVVAMKKGDAASLCYFTDSATAYDPRIQRVGRAFGRLVTGCGVTCGTLGKDEVDSGHEARRVGEEGLFEVLRDQNEQALAARTMERIVCSDPHAMNALRNDYSIETPVLHHSEMLAELVGAGRLSLAGLDEDRTYTFHDPCYLGRHNGVYDAPRRVLAAIPGLRTVEMTASRNRSFCCGGGSLYLFHEGEAERRMGEVRLDMAERAGAQVVVTACPFCLINFEDAVKTTGREGRMEILDLAELVARAALGETAQTLPNDPEASEA